MPKLKSLDELRAIRDKSKDNANLRITGENPDRTVLAVGMATCGIAAGARETMAALMEEIKNNGLDEKISIVATGCFGFCYAEPVVEVRTPGQPSIRYGYVDEKRARDIVKTHIMGGRLIDNAILGTEVSKP